jgi:hypothetical protein
MIKILPRFAAGGEIAHTESECQSRMQGMRRKNSQRVPSPSTELKIKTKDHASQGKDGGSDGKHLAERFEALWLGRTAIHPFVPGSFSVRIAAVVMPELTFKAVLIIWSVVSSHGSISTKPSPQAGRSFIHKNQKWRLSELRKGALISKHGERSSP